MVELIVSINLQRVSQINTYDGKSILIFKCLFTANHSQNSIFLLDQLFKWMLGRGHSTLVYSWGSGPLWSLERVQGKPTGGQAHRKLFSANAYKWKESRATKEWNFSFTIHQINNSSFFYQGGHPCLTFKFPDFSRNSLTFWTIFPDLKEHQLPRTGRLAHVPPGLTLLKRSILALIMPCLGKGCCIKNYTVTSKVQ